MKNKLREMFGLDLPDELVNTKITDNCPCNICPVYEKYEAKALYGSIAERQYAKLPDICDVCVKRINYKIACMKKLKWYEDNDENLKGEK